MWVTRKSQVTGIVRTVEIDVTEEQIRMWENGVLIQQAMPHLSSADREFIMTGVINDEWTELFGEE